jgi:hypothetical protein
VSRRPRSSPAEPQENVTNAFDASNVQEVAENTYVSAPRRELLPRHRNRALRPQRARRTPTSTGPASNTTSQPESEQENPTHAPAATPATSYLYPRTNINVVPGRTATCFPLEPVPDAEKERRRNIAAEARTSRLPAQDLRIGTVNKQQGHEQQKSLEIEVSAAVGKDDAKSDHHSQLAASPSSSRPIVPPTPATEEQNDEDKESSLQIFSASVAPDVVVAPTPTLKTTQPITTEIWTFPTGLKTLSEAITASVEVQAQALREITSCQEKTLTMITTLTKYQRSHQTRFDALSERMETMTTALSQPPTWMVSESQLHKVVDGVFDKLKAPQAATQPVLPQPLSQQIFRDLQGEYNTIKQTHGEVPAALFLLKQLVALSKEGYDVDESMSEVSTHLLRIHDRIEAPIQSQRQIEAPAQVLEEGVMDRNEGGETTAEQLHMAKQNAQLIEQIEIAEQMLQRDREVNQLAKLHRQREMEIARERVWAAQLEGRQRQEAEQAQQRAQHLDQQQVSFQSAYPHPAVAMRASQPNAGLNQALDALLARQPLHQATTYTAPHDFAMEIDTAPTSIEPGPFPRGHTSRERNAHPSTILCRYLKRIGGCRKRNACPNLHPSAEDPGRDVRSYMPCKHASTYEGCTKGSMCPYLHSNDRNDVGGGSVYPVPVNAQNVTSEAFGTDPSGKCHVSDELYEAMAEQLQPNTNNPGTPFTTLEGLLRYEEYMSNLLLGLTTSCPSVDEEEVVCEELLCRGNLLLQAIHASTPEVVRATNFSASMFRAHETALKGWDSSLRRGLGRRMPESVYEVKKMLQKLGREVEEKVDSRQSGPSNGRQNRNGAGSVRSAEPEHQKGGHQGSRGRGRDNGAQRVSKQQRQRPATTLYQPPSGPHQRNNGRRDPVRKIDIAPQRNNSYVRPIFAPHLLHEIVMGQANESGNNRSRRNDRNGRNNDGSRLTSAFQVGSFFT